jgi:hypothetical protein
MRTSILLLGFLASFAIAVPARADIPPPNSQGCDMKAAGDDCMKDDETAGTCVTEKCTKLDYSDGSPPTSVEYDCVLCNGPAAATSSSSSASSGGGDEPADGGGCSVRSRAAASAASAWALGAAVLLVARRLRGPGRKRRR